MPSIKYCILITAISTLNISLIACDDTEESGPVVFAGQMIDTPMAGTVMTEIPLAGTMMAGTSVAGTMMAGTSVAGTMMSGTPVAGTDMAIPDCSMATAERTDTSTKIACVT